MRVEPAARCSTTAVLVTSFSSRFEHEEKSGTDANMTFTAAAFEGFRAAPLCCVRTDVVCRDSMRKHGDSQHHTRWKRPLPTGRRASRPLLEKSD